MLTAIKTVLDSPAFRIFFAIWTGIYLAQVLKQESGAPSANELEWITIALAVALFFV